MYQSYRGSKVLMSNIYTVFLCRICSGTIIWQFGIFLPTTLRTFALRNEKEMKRWKNNFLFSFLFGRKVECFLEFSNSKVKAIWFPSVLFCTLHSRKIMFFYISITILRGSQHCHGWNFCRKTKFKKWRLPLNLNLSRVLYMSSSFWLLGVESRYFSQAEKERTACKAEQIQ